MEGVIRRAARIPSNAMNAMLKPFNVVIPRPSLTSSRTYAVRRDQVPASSLQGYQRIALASELSVLHEENAEIRNALGRLMTLSEELTIPANLRNESWKYDGQALAAITRWCTDTAPDLLEQLLQSVRALEEPAERYVSDSDEKWRQSAIKPNTTDHVLATLATVVYAAARFCPPCVDSGQIASPPHLKELLTPDRTASFPTESDPWCSMRAQRLAEEIIKLAQTVVSSLANAQKSSTEEILANHILSQRLRPLFQDATNSRSARLDPSSARPRHRDPNIVVHSMLGEQVPHEDEVIWKGGGAENGDPRLFRTVLTLEEKNEHVQLRSEALGCCNVLSYSLHFVGEAARRRIQDAENPWERLLPLILPPLLSVMDDPTPTARLCGVRILIHGPLRAEEAGGIPTSLLLRTSVTPILLASLETSLTYANDGRSAVGSNLLNASLAAARLLILRTTSPLRSSPEPLGGFQHADDGGKARATQLSNLITDGIFRVWTYLPAIVPTGSAGNPTAATLHVTSVWLARLSDDLGPLTARHASTAIDFLAAHITLGAGVGRASIEDVRAERAKCIVALSALEALHAVLNASANAEGSLVAPPGMATWTDRVLAAVCKCWTELSDWDESEPVRVEGDDTQEERKEGAENLKVKLRDELRKVWALVNIIDPKGSASFRALIKSLDPEMFAPLIEP